MTIVIEKYMDPDGLEATIKQEKYCKSFQACVYQYSENIPFRVYKRDFQTIENARRAIKRNFPGMKKTEV